MPINDWCCPKCGNMKEDVPDKTRFIICPCGAIMEKVPPRVSVRFKGEGFYENDYKKKID